MTTPLPRHGWSLSLLLGGGVLLLALAAGCQRDEALAHGRATPLPHSTASAPPVAPAPAATPAPATEATSATPDKPQALGKIDAFFASPMGRKSGARRTPTL